MNNWTIKTFVSKRGIDVIKEWIEDLPTKAQVAIDERIRFLSICDNWPTNYIRKLKEYKSIFEIRITSNKIQYRPLGCYGPGSKVFSILIGAIEKNNKLIPRNAPKTAEKRKQLIYQDERYLNEYF